LSLTLEYLPFAAAEIPVEKLFEFNGANYRLQVLWNEEGAFYSLKIASQDGADFYATKIVYGFNIIQAVVRGMNLKAQIVVVDPAELVSELPVRDEIARLDLGDGIRVYVFREAA